MKTYRVWFNIGDVGYADVEASSLEVAMILADDLEPEAYHQCHEEEWEVDKIGTRWENEEK